MQKSDPKNYKQQGREVKVLALPPLKFGWVMFLICMYIEMLVR